MVRQRDRRGWDEAFTQVDVSRVVHDGWLDRYEDLWRPLQGKPALDLGCGLGADTFHLLENGFDVTACDWSSVALARLVEKAPVVRTVQLDLREPLPFVDELAGVIVADLSLHYFDWRTTRAIMCELQRVLRTDGVLLLRVNSADDVHYGAGQGRQLEPNYFETNQGNKRFFDREHLLELLEGWFLHRMQEEEMTRYGMPKKLWEAAAGKLRS